MRRKQEPTDSGSQRWLQIAVNRCPTVIDAAIRETGVEMSGDIDWVSPLENDDFAEYADSDFLDRLDICLKRRPLMDFWPPSGPRWDGLARCGDSVLLIEAKAYVAELATDPCGAGGESRRKIEDAMSETKAFLRVGSKTDWTRCFYQYANRLAHLYLLRELNGFDAYLLNIYFVGDKTRKMPASRADWVAAATLAKAHLRLSPSSRWLAAYAKDVFVDVAPMEHVDWP